MIRVWSRDVYPLVSKHGNGADAETQNQCGHLYTMCILYLNLMCMYIYVMYNLYICITNTYI